MRTVGQVSDVLAGVAIVIIIFGLIKARFVNYTSYEANGALVVTLFHRS
jgi:hypothetical protein